MIPQPARRWSPIALAGLVGLVVGITGGVLVADASTFTCTGPNPCNGTSDNDSITGRQVHDQIHGREGSDAVNSLGENDDITGDQGPDALYGNYGQDDIEGNANNEWWTCLGGGDCGIDGQDGADTLDGGNDSDAIRGGSGDDVINGGSGDSAYDKCWGGAGSDQFAHCAVQD